jgi:hypothetical protein
MAVQVRPLIEVLRELPEARKRRGIRHPQAALLALACAALLCGHTSYGQIAAWGRSYGRAQRARVDALGFTHPLLSCEVTCYHLFRKLDIGAFERALAAWAAPILAATAPRSGAADGVAIDGKWLRGSATRGAPGAQVLAAVSHRRQQTLGQVAVAGGDEVGAGRTLLADLLLEGRVLTMDALFTQGDLAQTVVEGGWGLRDGGQGQSTGLARSACDRVHGPPARCEPPWQRHVEHDKGHGRLERRVLTAAVVDADLAA